MRHQLGEQHGDSSLAGPMFRRGRWAHDDLAMSIRFNTPFELREFGVRKQFIPAAHIEAHLVLLRRQFNGQRGHDVTVPRSQPECKRALDLSW